MSPRQTLRQRQSQFARMVPQLIMHAYSLGYEITLGEVERSQAVADANARAGKGISNSLHGKRLAIDLHLFRDGKYLTDTESHRLLGEYWESIGGSWGGRFGDGNHYSLSWEGVR